MVDDAGDVARVVQGRRPGSRDQPGLHDQRLSLPPAVARLAQAAGLWLPAVGARQRLTGLFGGGRGRALGFGPRQVGCPGRVPPGLLPPPSKVFGLQGGLLAQPLLEDLAALGLGKAGHLRVNLGCDPGAVSTPDVDHVAAVLAVGAGVQPDSVVASRVRARPALDQTPADQPPERVPDQGLSAGLLQPVGEPVGQQLRRRLRLHQQVRQPGQLHLRRLRRAALLPAVQLPPQPLGRLQRHLQTKIIGKCPPPPLLRLSTPHDCQLATGLATGSTLPVLPFDRGNFWLFPAQRANPRHRQRRLGNGGLVLARARALRPTAFTPTAFAGKATREPRKKTSRNPRSVDCVELCTIGTLPACRLHDRLRGLDPRRIKATGGGGRTVISARTIGTR